MKKLFTEVKDTMRAIPGIVTAVFLFSVVAMNLLANKAIFNLPWLASTAGTLVSWISFLCMDVVCKRFGARAATIMNSVTTVMALLGSVLFMLIVKIPGNWASSYAYTDKATVNAINASIDGTFSSAWYVILGSSAAMFIGGLVNAVVNKLIGKKFDKSDTYGGFALRSFISTSAGQYADNFAFNLFVAYIFFGWPLKQVIIISAVEMLIELVFEIIFSPAGYRLAKNWKRDNVGKAYIERYGEKYASK